MAAAAASLRATSLAASAALLAAMMLAAMTMRFTMAPSDAHLDAAPINIVQQRPEPPPPKPDIRRPPPLTEANVIAAEPPTDIAQAPPRMLEPALFAPPQPPAISDPHWLRRPRDLGRFYPVRARAAGIEGVVVLDCAVSPQGALDCAIVSETPPGWGFGDAAQRISREHRMAPALRDGVPIEARYRMRLPFQLD
jgi:periplasmic protein TonB